MYSIFSVNIDLTIITHLLQFYRNKDFTITITYHLKGFKKLSLNDVASFVAQLWCMKVSALCNAWFKQGITQTAVVGVRSVLA